MEHTFSLSTHDGYMIHGVINQANEAPARKAVVIAHGMPCTIREYLYVETAKYMNAHGYDVIRFGFYGQDENARRLEKNATLETQTQDLNTVVDHFASTYRDVFIAGHSYGGLTAVMANSPKARAICLFDSTLCPDTAFAESEATFEPETGAYRYKSFVDVLINPEMVHQANALTEKDLNAAAAKITAPVRLIYANDGTPRSQEEEFFAAFQGPKTRTFLDDTDHFFTQGNSAARALAISLAWFEAHGTAAPASEYRPQQRHEM